MESSKTRQITNENVIVCKIRLFIWNDDLPCLVVCWRLVIEVNEKVGHRCLVDIFFSVVFHMSVINLFNYLNVNFSCGVLWFLFPNILDQWSININISSYIWVFSVRLSSKYSNIPSFWTGNNQEIVCGFYLISTIISLSIRAIHFVLPVVFCLFIFIVDELKLDISEVLIVNCYFVDHVLAHISCLLLVSSLGDNIGWHFLSHIIEVKVLSSDVPLIRLVIFSKGVFHIIVGIR